jgi:tRNA U38,U39,U40 pseudouridine synthase TruA
MAYEISGDGFLRHMVRAIVGTLVEIGRGFREPESWRHCCEVLHAATQVRRHRPRACSWSVWIIINCLINEELRRAA